MWSLTCLGSLRSLSGLPPVLAAQVKALGYDGNSPASVPSWLDSLGLQDYVHSFLSSGYSSIDTVKNLWELELVNVSAVLLSPEPRVSLATLWRGWDPRRPLTVPRHPTQVLKVHLLGHRKRIIASLADRPYEEPPQKPPRFSQLRVSWMGGEGGVCALCRQELKRIF